MGKREMWRGGDEGLAADFDYVMYGKVSEGCLAAEMTRGRGKARSGRGRGQGVCGLQGFRCSFARGRMGCLLFPAAVRLLRSVERFIFTSEENGRSCMLQHEWYHQEPLLPKSRRWFCHDVGADGAEGVVCVCGVLQEEATQRAGPGNESFRNGGRIWLCTARWQNDNSERISFGSLWLVQKATRST